MLSRAAEAHIEKSTTVKTEPTRPRVTPRRDYLLCEFHGTTADTQMAASRNTDHAQDVNASDQDSGMVGQPDKDGDALRPDA
jgi:hypothetical protein